MKLSNARNIATSAALVLAASGCTTSPAVQEIPAELRVAAGQSLFLESLAVGVQIYQCAPNTREGAMPEWVFRAPEASLTNATGQIIGKHYAGPTWEFLDGSIVTGEVRARAPASDPNAIPWLLLTAKTKSDDGIFSQVTSIHRTQTKGGNAPSEKCDAESVGKTMRIPYSATYYFYRRNPVGYGLCEATASDCVAGMYAWAQ